MSFTNVKTEPITPTASAIPVQRNKTRPASASPSPVMPKPLEERAQIKVERSTSPLHRRRLEMQHINKGRLMGGDEMADVPATSKQARKERSPKVPKGRATQPNDETVKMRAALMKYEETVGKLMQKLKSNQKMYKAAIRDLQQTNSDIRDELSSVQNSVIELSAQREVEQERVSMLQGDNSSLVEKNVQLTEDLSRIIDNLQHSDEVLKEMRLKLTERDTEMMNLTEEKKYLAQQLNDMRRLSRFSVDAFAPEGNGNRCAGEMGILDWFFCQKHGMGVTSRMVGLGLLLCLGVGLIFQNFRSAEAMNPMGECDYEMEMLSGHVI